MPGDPDIAANADVHQQTNEGAEEALLAALQSLIQPRIVCTNMVRELETINSLQPIWPSHLEGLSLEVHLHCEHAANECTAIVQILDAFIAHLRGARGAPTPELPMLIEAGIRQSNALEELVSLSQTARRQSSAPDPGSLELQELLGRSERAADKLKRLGGMVESLQSHLLTSPWWQHAFGP